MAKQFFIFATTCFLLVAFTSHCYAVTCITLDETLKPPTVVAKLEPLENHYQNSRSIDEPLLAAIDGDFDGFLNSSKNTTNGVNIVDAEYYYLSNRLGSISAILDADNQDRILEYYRYEVFGSATVLPIVDTSPVDGLEDTPLDLNDNNNAGPTLVSSFGNTYLYTARRFDDVTGLYYYRNRYYDPRSGRFVTRDPAESPQNNLYGYTQNGSTYFVDPYGLSGSIPEGYTLTAWWTENGEYYTIRDGVLYRIIDPERKIEGTDLIDYGENLGNLERAEGVKGWGVFGGYAATTCDECNTVSLELVTQILDILGFVPIIGDVADIASAGIELASGDVVSAALSMLSVIPGLDAFTKPIKWALKAGKKIGASTLLKLGKLIDKIPCDSLKAKAKSGLSTLQSALGMRAYYDHALEAMVERGVSFESVEEAIKKGKVSPGNKLERIVYELSAADSSTGRAVRVVTEKTGEVVTVIDRGSKK